MSDPDSSDDVPKRRITRVLRAVAEFLEGGQRVLAAAAGIVVALATVYAVLVGAGSDGHTATSAQSSVTPPPVSTARSLNVRCRLDRPPRPGTTVQLTYRVTSSEDLRVGLGAGLYDDAGNDHSTGEGDQDSVEIPVGTSNLTRPVLVPRDLARGHYELNGEIWPENRVGAEGAELLREAPCARFVVR